MNIYYSEEDAERAEGVIDGIDDQIYNDISEAEDDYVENEGCNIFAFYIDNEMDKFKVGWN